MVDPVAPAGPGLRSENRAFGSLDLPIDDHADARRNCLIDILRRLLRLHCDMKDSLPTSKPRLLFITSHAPDGQDNGSRLRARNILLQLSKHADVTLILAGAYERYTGNKLGSRSLSPAHVIEFETWKVGGFINRVRYEIGSSYLNTHGARASVENCELISKMVCDHDMVWLHGLRVANGFNIWNWPKTILDIDDIPSAVEKSKLIRQNTIFGKLRAIRRFYMWKRHESRIFERFNALSVCSQLDMDHFGKPQQTFVVSNGFDPPSTAPVRNPCKQGRIGFIGTLEYGPNADGIRWFLREVWPIILEKCPKTTLRLVGRGSRGKEWCTAQNVEGLGWLTDADSEMATWAMTIVPIFEGGGTRIKISNAFSRKCPVVSTKLGAYGYEVRSGEELLMADSPSEFGMACLRILEDLEFSNYLAETAWEAFLRRWTWDANAVRIWNVLRFLSKKRDITA